VFGNDDAQFRVIFFISFPIAASLEQCVAWPHPTRRQIYGENVVCYASSTTITGVYDEIRLTDAIIVLKERNSFNCKYCLFSTTAEAISPESFSFTRSSQFQIFQIDPMSQQITVPL